MNESVRMAAEAQAKRLETERQIEKYRENAKLVAEQKATADRDAACRARSRTLLAESEEEEGTGLSALEKPSSASSKKTQLAKLLGGGA